MKKSLLAIAALTAFAGAAQAQSSVTVYGIVDVGVMGATNSGNLNNTTWGVSGNPTGARTNNTINNGNAVGFMAGGESMSRLGFKGSEDLGGGTKAIFLLEQGFNAGTGNAANTGMAGNNVAANANQGGGTALQGQLFNRGAYAGLSNDTYGQLTAGRQQNLMLDLIPSYDPVNAQMFSPINFSGTYGGGGQTEDSRVNNALKYGWKSASGFNANALYGLGGISGNTSAGSTSAIQAGYDNQKFGIQTVWQHTTDAIALSGSNPGAALSSASTTATAAVSPTSLTAQAPMGYNATLKNTTSFEVVGKYQATDSFGIKAGYQRIYLGTPSNYQLFSNQATTASGYQISQWAAQTVNYGENVLWLGANYNFTPAIKGSIGYYYVGVPAYVNGATGNTTGATGKQQFESAMVEYYMSKRTNLYAAVMNMNASGGQVTAANTNSAYTGVVSSQVTYGLGVRHSF